MPVKEKILIIQENGHHVQNRRFRECFSLQRAFKHLGVCADVWGKGHNNYHLRFKDIVSAYDAVISLENYDTGWHPDLSSLKLPRVFWCIDAHMGVDRYLNFVRKNRFDIVYNSSVNYVDKFIKLADRSLWLPNAYDSFLIDRLFNVKKTIPLGFCGNVVNRGEWIKHLKKKWGLRHDEMVIGHDMVKAVNSYRIHWNLNVSDDINYRIFETLGCRTFLLTNYTQGIEQLFKPGKHLVLYNNIKELDEKISYYIKHPERRDKIAHEGYNHVCKKHRYIDRARQILTSLGISIDVLKNKKVKLEQGQIMQDVYEWCHGNQRRTEAKHIPEDQILSNKAARIRHSLPIAIVTETMNYVSGGVRCIAEVLNRLSSRGYQTSCYVTHSDLRCCWLKVDFPIEQVSKFNKFRGIAISPYSPTAKIVAHSNAIGKFYWVHSYEPKFPELTGRSDAWRVMSENSYRFPELQYFTTSSYVKMILELIYHRHVLSPLVPGGVDTELFKPSSKGKNNLRIMFLSREHRFRGALDIRDALKNIQNHGVDISVYVMGKPVDMQDIPYKLVPPLPQPDFAKLLGSMDLFIHASHFEGLPLPPLEAMACKCAVISTYVGASDYLLDGYNALVVPPKRPDKISEAILRLAKNPDLRKKIGEGGYQTVINGYTWENTVDRLLEALVEGLTLNKRHFTSTAKSVAKPDKCLLQDSAPGYLVTAIVSAYNSEKYIRGCLEDLEVQTISDRVEIIVVNSGSKQNEEAIVKEFIKKYSNIKYIKIENRQSVYAAWNCGIKAASGKYITNANTDDRHRKDAFEQMVHILEKNPDISLVYADVWVTKKENETFDNFTPGGSYCWKDFDPKTLIDGCYIGPQPMWRKNLHEKYGLFDESFESAGDWEFWLRICEKEKFYHLKEFLGLYLKSPDSIEHRDKNLSRSEAVRVHKMYALKKGNQNIPSDDIIEKVLDKADILSQKGQVDNAVDLLLAGIKGSPREKKLYYLLSEILISIGRHKDALNILYRFPNFCETAVNCENKEGREDDTKLLELAGYCLEGMKEHEEAEKVINKVLSLNKQSASALNLKGVLEYEKDKRNAAIEYFNHAIRSDPGFGKAYTNLGLAQLESGNSKEALIYLEKGFILSPTEQDVVTAYHEVISELGAFERAEPLFKESYASYPYNKRLSYLFIDILIQQKKFNAAIVEIEKAMAAFGIDDGILAPALNVRNMIGPVKIDKVSEKKSTISLCMIVEDEEKNLAKCLASAKPVVDEIIVVDTGSADRTKDIARVFGARVFDYEWSNDFSRARNYSLSKAEGDWIFVLDADELVSSKDYEFFIEFKKNLFGKHVAFEFTTRNYMDDIGVEGWRANDGIYPEETGSGWNPSIKVRLFPNDSRIKFENRVHELVEPALRKIGFKIEKSQVPIHHYGKLENREGVTKEEKYYNLGKLKLGVSKDNFSALVEHAIQANEIGKYQEAVKLWQGVIELKPEFARAYFNMGYAYIQMEQYEDAKAASKKAMMIDPEIKEAVLNCSLCEIYVGDIKYAILLLDDFLKKNPEHPMAMGLIAVSYCVDGKKDKGIGYLGKIKKMGFNCSEYVFDHAKKLISAGRENYALSLMQAAVESKNTDRNIFSLLNRSSCLSAESSRVNIFFCDILENFPKFAQDLKPLSDLCQLDDELFSAAKCSNEADFVIFPYSVDSLFHKLGYEDFIKFLRRLPGFENNEHKFVFFFQDDIGSLLNLKSVIYKVNHDKKRMDVNSITLPYFVDDIYKDHDQKEYKYHVNFVGTIVTHAVRAYMVLGFLKKNTVPDYESLLEEIGHLLASRKNEEEYINKIDRAVLEAEKIFPLITECNGLKYFIDVSVEQHHLLPDSIKKKRRQRLVDVMNDSAATLCPRGFGVQSARFFETMSAGRIPVLISDNYILPLEERIDYDSFVCRLDESKIMNIKSDISSFFDMYDQDGIAKKCRLARKVWAEYFTESKISKYIYLTLSKVLMKNYCLNKKH